MPRKETLLTAGLWPVALCFACFWLKVLSASGQASASLAWLRDLSAHRQDSARVLMALGLIRPQDGLRTLLLLPVVVPPVRLLCS